MSGEPSTSRERIIPIQIEGDDNSPIEDNDREPSVERIVPIQMETDNSTEEQIRSTSVSPSEISEPVSPVNIPIKRNLPMCNVKEKIILVVDSAEDENYTPFRLNNGQQNKPLDMLKRAVELFLHNKLLINKKHEYALAVLNENSVMWLVDFTSNINEVIKALQGINSCETEDVFELNSLFDVILQKVKMPLLCEVESTILPPPFIVHTILLYGRSYTMPKLLQTDEIEELLKSPYFTLDVLMTHEQVDNNNNCNKIFNVLQNLDQKGFAYFFSVGRDTGTLFSSTGKLLGHPLQRPTQQLANYGIKEQ